MLSQLLLQILNYIQRHVITLCVYAHQGYVFGHIGLCIYGQKLAVWGLTIWKSSVGVIYCSAKKEFAYYIWQVIHSGKEIQKHSIKQMDGIWVLRKLYYSKPCLIYIAVFST